MIPTGIFLSMIPSDNWIRTGYVVVHKTIGIIILALVIARIIWNRRSKRPALDKSLKSMDRKLAHTAHILLYILMIAVPITGYFMTSFHGYPSYFFILKIPPFMAESDIYQVWGLFHKYLLQYLLYIVLGAHILGVLKHHFIDKHKSAIKRIVG
jgi:cytochrome b561